MRQSANPSLAAAGESSPVKRALIEIRQLRAELERSKRGTHESVAIVGMAMRFPGGVTTPERFWQALAEGEDLIGAIPAERWDAREYLNPDPDHVGTMCDGHGGFLSAIDTFDAEFFGINPREAASMDPQQRMLLELTWEALERAAIDPKALFNTSAGVFLGLSNCDYARYTMRDPREIDAYASVGCTLSIAAGRISYFLGTHGPALVVDTACSSSLVALHLAVESLRRGEIDLAIVGAANLILTPEYSVSFSRTRMLSHDGRSKTFDASADGYVRSEGCGVVLLRRLADAKRDGDPVLANIAGSALNQDGRSAGITAPNGPAQEAVIRAALDDAQVAPAAVTFVETHGTGTPLGDPMEVQALSAVYGNGRDGGSPLHIGSVKTNLGHAEAAAGMAGLMKVVLTMQPGHGIAPHLHFKEPNPKIDWKGLPIKVPTTLTPWPQTESGTRYAGLSSFGFSGTNAHVIVASAEEDGPAVDAADDSHVESVLVISASHPESLRKLAESYVAFLQQTRERFSDICFTAVTGRASLEHRLALRARDPRAAASMLEQWLAGKTVVGLVSKESAPEGAKDKSMEMVARFVCGEALRWDDLTSPRGQRRVALPVYPFRKTRYWFGPDPQKKRQIERERMWQSAVSAAEVQSRQGPLGWNPDSYAEKWLALHRLTLAHAQNVLAEAGAFRQRHAVSADEVQAQCGFQPLYGRLVQRWLEGLVASGVLVAEGNRFRALASFAAVSLETYWRETEQQLQDNPGMMAYLRQCSAVLGDVLKGRKSSLETLFPQGSFSIAEGLYETGPEARYLNPIAATAVSQVVQGLGQRRNARVLEIGGGTGGTTSAILPALPAGQVEYWFTDVSELFLNRAQRKFGAYPFMHYALFDLDRPLEEQGIGTGQFDVIVAANVVHASRNLMVALERVRRLLAPGGMLVLLECTTHHRHFDMTVGLIEGWQHFEDDIRQEHPLLHIEQWRSLLEANGFSSMVALPESNSPASAIGQHILIARSAEAGQAESDVMSQKPVADAEWRSHESMQAEGIGEQAAADRLRALAPNDREQAVLDLVRTTIQRVFNLSQRAEELTARDRLSDLGMDSLIALELRAELAKVFGLEAQISSTIAFDTGTVGELAKALLRTVETSGHAEIQSNEAEVQDQDLPSVAQVTLDELNEMSDEDVERLLSERLSRR